MARTPLYRGQGNDGFKTADARPGAKRGQTIPYDVNGVPTGGYTDAQARIAAQEWAPNFTAAASVYIPAREAMTIAQGNAKIGTGTITFEKSTTAAPSTFSSTTLPVTLQAGAWLRVIASGVAGFVATHLIRTA